MIFARLLTRDLKPVLEETEKTMKSIRAVTDNVATVTGNIKEVSEAASDVAENIRAVSMIIDDVGDQDYRSGQRWHSGRSSNGAWAF